MEPTPADHGVRRALVTGASRGVGRAVTEALVARGVHVWAVARDAGRLEALAAGDQGPGSTVARAEGMVHPIVADLTVPASIDAVVAAVHATGRPLDVLVHAAGVARVDSPAEDLAAVYAEHAAVNVVAPMRLTAALLDHVRAARGLVVVVNSAAALRAAGGFAAYASSKGALRSWTDALRADLAGQGVRVTSLFPGQVATDMQAAIYAARAMDYRPEVLLQPGEVGALVGFLVDHPTVELTEVSLRSAAAGYHPHSG